MSEPLKIDGKLVTEKNAWRFVKARVPDAEVSRHRGGGFDRGTTYYLVRARGCAGDGATGNTSGLAWLSAARRIVERDAQLAAEVAALREVRVALYNAETRPERERAALAYAAVRLEQTRAYGSPAQVAALRRMVEEMKL